MIDLHLMEFNIYSVMKRYVIILIIVYLSTNVPWYNHETPGCAGWEVLCAG